LTFVEEEELKGMGMKTVQIRRLRHAVRATTEVAAPAPASTLANGKAAAASASSAAGRSLESQAQLDAGISRPVSPAGGSTQSAAKPQVVTGSE
jgi:hypothetical protein